MLKSVFMIRWFIHGLLGLVKALIGFDKASKEDIEKRRLLCKTCLDRRVYMCEDCKCFLPAKIRVKSEMCPKYYWY